MFHIPALARLRSRIYLLLSVLVPSLTGCGAATTPQTTITQMPTAAPLPATSRAAAPSTTAPASVPASVAPLTTLLPNTQSPGCFELFEITEATEPAQMPVCVSQPLAQADQTIDRVVIMIHGTGRDAEEYYNVTTTAADAASVENTLVIVPFFPDQDAAKEFDDGPASTLAWSGSGWREGDASLAGEDQDDDTNEEDDENSDDQTNAAGISSYTVMDQVVQHVANRQRFPNLRAVVLAGHSAGGQFVQRYAASTAPPQQLAADRGIQMSYVVSNPSSYLYLTNERRVDGSTTEFAVPSSAEITECPEYNDYRYGLDELPPYLAQVGADQIQTRYAQSNVVYLLGEKDNQQDESLDDRCAAQLQGAQRLERGTIYYNALLDQFGPDIGGTHRQVIVPGVGHDNGRMFISHEGLQVLFGVDPATLPDPLPSPPPEEEARDEEEE